MVNMHGMFESVSAQLDECRDFLSPLLQRLDLQCQVGFEMDAKRGDSRKGRPLIDVVMSLVLIQCVIMCGSNSRGRSCCRGPQTTVALHHIIEGQKDC